MEQQRVKWVSFDCYGTLVDWRGGFRSLLEPLSDGRTDELLHAYHDAELAIEEESPGASYKDVLRLSLGRAAQAIGLTISDDERDVLVRDWGSLPLFPDTEHALKELRADGWKLAILTNCDDDLFALTSARFPVPIDLVVTAEEVHSYKPALGHFSEFERRSGVDRSEWVHAAVSWWHDMRPAAELGIRRVWVDRERSGEDESITSAHIYDMGSLPGTLRSQELLPRTG